MSSAENKISEGEVRSDRLTGLTIQVPQISWFQSPGAWLLELQSENYAHDFRWLSLHHQLLTLAQTSARSFEHRRDGGRGLWFRSEHGHYGALIPGLTGEVLALTYDPTRWLPTQTDELVAVFEPQTILMAREALDRIDTAASPYDFTILHEETARLRMRPASNLATVDIGFRRARSPDLALLRKWALLFDEELRSTESFESSTLGAVEALTRTGTLFIASQNGVPFGMVALTGTYSMSGAPLLTRISLAFVAKEKRRLGLGSIMIEALCHEIELEKNGRPILFSDSKSQEASLFYERLGFESCGSIVVLRADEKSSGNRVTTTGK